MKKLKQYQYLLASSVLFLFSFTFITPIFAEVTGASTSSALEKEVVFYDEHIRDYVINVDVSSDGTLNVKERIVYNFGLNGGQKHGIFRFIPKSKVPGSLYSPEVSLISITDEKGDDHEYVDQSDDSQAKYRIGNKDVFVDGEKVYNIEYTVTNPLGYFKGFTELYFNYIGTEWKVPIAKTSIKVKFPEGVKIKDTKIYCGDSGSKDICATVEYKGNQMSINVLPGKILGSGEGVTAATSFERGFFTSEPTIEYLDKLIEQEKIRDRKLNLIYLIPLISFLFYFRKFINIRRSAKYKKTHPLIAQYDSGGLSPIEASFFQNEFIHDHDFIAEITYLLAYDYIRVNEDDKSGEKTITIGSQPVDDLKSFQKEIVETVVGAEYAKVGESFYGKISKIRSEVKKSIKDAGLVTGYIPTYKIPSFSFWALLFLLVNPGVFVGIAGFGYIGQDWYRISIVYSATLILLYILSKIFKARGAISFTEEGLKIKRQIEGLRLYINIAEKERIVADADPEKNVQIVEKLLPYAIIFGMEARWLAYLSYLIEHTITDESSRDLHTANIISYHSINTGAASIFSSYEGHASSVRASHSSSSSGSSSGSSGGGGGGGGGGSW